MLDSVSGSYLANAALVQRLTERCFNDASGWLSISRHFRSHCLVITRNVANNMPYCRIVAMELLSIRERRPPSPKLMKVDKGSIGLHRAFKIPNLTRAETSETDVIAP